MFSEQEIPVYAVAYLTKKDRWQLMAFVPCGHSDAAGPEGSRKYHTGGVDDDFYKTRDEAVARLEEFSQPDVKFGGRGQATPPALVVSDIELNWDHDLTPDFDLFFTIEDGVVTFARIAKIIAGYAVVAVEKMEDNTWWFQSFIIDGLAPAGKAPGTLVLNAVGSMEGPFVSANRMHMYVAGSKQVAHLKEAFDDADPAEVKLDTLTWAKGTSPTWTLHASYRDCVLRIDEVVVKERTKPRCKSAPDFSTSMWLPETHRGEYDGAPADGFYMLQNGTHRVAVPFADEGQPRSVDYVATGIREGKLVPRAIRVNVDILGIARAKDTFNWAVIMWRRQSVEGNLETYAFGTTVSECRSQLEAQLMLEAAVSRARDPQYPGKVIARRHTYAEVLEARDIAFVQPSFRRFNHERCFHGFTGPGAEHTHIRDLVVATRPLDFIATVGYSRKNNRWHILLLIWDDSMDGNSHKFLGFRTSVLPSANLRESLEDSQLRGVSVIQEIAPESNVYVMKDYGVAFDEIDDSLRTHTQVIAEVDDSGNWKLVGVAGPYNPGVLIL